MKKIIIVSDLHNTYSNNKSSYDCTPKNIIFVEYLLLNSANEVKTKIFSFGYLFKILFSNIGSNKCIVC
jgi:hypothetical protein